MLTFDIQVHPEEYMEYFDREYFVRARTFNGGRHYSESLPLEAAKVRFNEFCGVVKYFGGGYVELVESNFDDYEVIISDWVM